MVRFGACILLNVVCEILSPSPVASPTKILFPTVVGAMVIAVFEVKFPAFVWKLMLLAMMLMGLSPASSCDPSNTFSVPFSGTLIVAVSVMVMLAAFEALPLSPRSRSPCSTSKDPLAIVISPSRVVSTSPDFVSSANPLSCIFPFRRIWAPPFFAMPLFVVSMCVSAVRLMFRIAISEPFDAMVPATVVTVAS